jgi:hypothetical protein
MELDYGTYLGALALARALGVDVASKAQELASYRIVLREKAPPLLAPKDTMSLDALVRRGLFPGIREQLSSLLLGQAGQRREVRQVRLPDGSTARVLVVVGWRNPVKRTTTALRNTYNQPLQVDRDTSRRLTRLLKGEL